MAKMNDSVSATTNTDNIVGLFPGTISTITQPVNSQQGRRNDVAESSLNIGQYSTPPLKTMTTNESLYEEGCDSDGEGGPFYDIVYGVELNSFHEEAIREELPQPVDEMNHTISTSENDENAPNRFNMSDEQIMSLKKEELLEQCKMLGLDRRGNKGPIQERLKNHENMDFVIYERIKSITQKCNSWHPMVSVL